MGEVLVNSKQVWWCGARHSLQLLKSSRLGQQHGLVEKPPLISRLSPSLVSHSLQAVEPWELLLPLTSESTSLFLTHTLDLLSFSLWPGGIPWCFLFSQGSWGREGFGIVGTW